MNVTISKQQPRLALAIALLGVAGGLWAGTAQATLIIQDTFTASNATPPNGRTPSPTDLPGGNWVTGGTAIGNNALAIGGDGSVAISIASAGTYTKPGVFVISADLNLATTAGLHPSNSYGDGHSVYGINLGFFPVAGGNTARGIVYTVSTNDLSQGELLLVNNGNTIVQDLGFTGFGTNGTYNLSYRVNTANGSLSDVMFNGNPIAVGNTTLFTDAATMLAGAYQRPDGANATSAALDNFTIDSVVPEPSTILLLGLGGLLLAWRRRAGMMS